MNDGINDWPQVNAWRREQREALRAARLALAPAERRALADRIARALAEGFPELTGTLVGFYWPIRGEADLRPLMTRHVTAGGRAALPVVVARNAPVEFREWRPGMKLAPGVWKIPVPPAGGPVRPAILLAPLLGFDEAGYRLGNGGGYYDRTLAALASRPLAIGVGYAQGRLASIRPQPHDVPLDAIVTEHGVHWPPLLPASAGEDERCGGFSSPVCYADEAAPEYSGYWSREETLAWLDGLLATERAAVRLLGSWAAALGGTRADPAATHLLEDVQRDAARACALLGRLIHHLGGVPGRESGVCRERFPAPADARARLTFLRRACRAVARRLAGALPRLADEALRRELGQLQARHEEHAARVGALAHDSA